MAVDIEIVEDITASTDSRTLDITPSTYEVTIEDSKDLDVTINKKEYNIVGDELYIPKLYEDAPAWLQNLVDETIRVSLEVERSNLNSATKALNELIAEVEVAKNTYTQSIISSSDIDTRINTAITTLNSSLAAADATILGIAQTAVTPDEATALTIDGINAELVNPDTGSLGATIASLNQARVDGDSANATSIDTLVSTLEGEVDARATAVQYLNTYVGLDENGTATGVGTLDTILNDIQNQVDGSITSWFENGEPSLVNTPANTWNTTTEKNNHIGDMYYDRDTGYSYRFAYEDIPDDTPDEGITYSWIRITDTDITKALADAAEAQETADGKVTTFYQDSAPTAEGEGDIWIDSNDGNKMYRWNGSSWGSDLVGAMVANASAVTELEADLASTNATVGGHTTQLSTVDTRIDNGMATVETKWAYDSIVNINGVYKKSGFGLTTNYTSGNGTEVDPYVSAFWIDASRLKFTNSNQTGQVAPFTIDATGTDPEITFNGKVTFGSVNNVYEDKLLDTIQAYDSKMGAVPAYGSALESNITSQTDGSIKLYHSSDNEIGLAFPAVDVSNAGDDGVNFKLSFKSSVNVTSGIYIRVYEYDSDLPSGKTHVSNGASVSSSVVQEDTRGKTSFYENLGATTEWTTKSFTYIPTSTAKWASVVVLNWNGAGLAALYLQGFQMVVNTTSVPDVSGAISASNETFAQAQGFASYQAMMDNYSLNGLSIVTGGYISTGLVDANSLKADSAMIKKLLAQNIVMDTSVSESKITSADGGMVIDFKNGSIYIA